MARKGARWVERAEKEREGLFLRSMRRTRGWRGAVAKRPLGWLEVLF